MTHQSRFDAIGATRWRAAINRLLRWVLWLALLQATAQATPTPVHGRVVRVADGDTVTLLDAQQVLHSIRLAGIDAPESAMPYGQTAKLFLAALVLGKDVDALTYKQDRYRRTIATLMLGPQDVNLALIQAGLAWHYKRYANEQPAAEARAYAQAEELARMQHLALWQDSDPVAPWDWRAGRRVQSRQNAGAIMRGGLAMGDRAAP